MASTSSRMISIDDEITYVPTSSRMISIDDEITYVKKELFNNVMRGNWKRVVEIYENYPVAHMSRISRSGYTALHLAVSNGKEEIIEQLVKLITRREQPRKALELQNERGYTALHFAAAMGNLRMCTCIANADPSLVGVRNKEGETPLFWAVLYGQQEAFFCLHSIISSPTESGPKISKEDAYSYCRRKDHGETILHCAIYGEDFDLAFQIINQYKELVHYVDEEGFSPLDTLATKPSCFKSGSNLRGWDKIIYKCIYVNEFKASKVRTDTVDHLSRHSENHPTFVKCFGTFVKVVRSLLRIGIGDQPPIPDQRHRSFPDNYMTCYEFLKLIYKAMLVIFGYGHTKINLIREEKEKHVWAVQVLDELLKNLNMYDSLDLQSGGNPGETGEIDREHDEILNALIEEDDKTKKEKEEDKKTTGKEHKGTAILIAAKNGIAEIVDKILGIYPVAIHDTDQNMKNILLLAAEHRQLEVYKLLLRHKEILRDIVFRKVDNHRNSALHFAAMFNKDDHKPWPIPGAALQMQWEIKWYKFVEKSMPPHFFLRANKDGETPEEIFTKTHKELVKAGGEWLTSTSTSCSVVAALIATVAFSSSTTFPGGTDSRSGKPTLENQTSFQLFALSSLVALCFSVTSLIIFLAILTSRHQEKDFGKDLPRKLLLGLSSLFVSIASMITSFCAGHFLVLEDKLKFLAFPVYAVTFVPVCLFAMAQFPLYLDLIRATFLSPF